MTPALSLYDTTIPMFIKSLQSLGAILTKAESATSVSASDLTTARLAPDMLPLTFQIQTACNTAKFTAVRAAGVPNLPMDDKETTFEELQARLARTVEFLEAVKREDFEGKEGNEVVFMGHKFTSLSYVTSYAIPNFYFHVACAYAILRMKGINIGKLDYLGVNKSDGK